VLYGVYGVLGVIREAIQYGLVFSALIAALFATRLLKEPSQIEARTEARRLIALAVTDETVDGILKEYNHAVRRGEGVTNAKLGSSVATWLEPVPGSAQTEQQLLSELGRTVDGIVRPSAEPGAWTHQRLGSETSIRKGDRWPNIDGCDERVVAINARYGPLACAAPSGTLWALEGSPGVPKYAQDLFLRTTLRTEDLDSLLARIEAAFRLEAKVSIFNEGDNSSRGIRVVVPPGWTVPKVWSPRNNPDNCRASGEDPNSDFTLGALGSCLVTYVLEPDARGFLPLTPPSFAATAEEPPLLGIVFWILIVAGILVVLYLVADLLVNWDRRTGQGLR
jgi:hypothetical protein